MKKILYLLITLMAVSAFVSGLLLIRNPMGESMGLSLSLLEGSPFPDYFFPGILLILLIGTPHLLSLIYLARNHRHQFLMVMASGLVLMSWIIIQILLIHTANWMHYYCLGTGLMEVLIALQLKGKWVL